MARPEIGDLYQQLLRTRFEFVGVGERHIHNVYRAIKARFPSLCDDSYLCADNCSQGHNQPEWQHTVRKALDRLKSGHVSKSDRRGFWIFK